jgi:hypothetical protein
MSRLKVWNPGILAVFHNTYGNIVIHRYHSLHVRNGNYILTYIHTYTHACLHTSIHAYMQTCIHAADMHACIHTYMTLHTLRYIHTYSTYITYITYIQTYITLHYTTLHYITLHYNTLHYTTLHYIHTYIISVSSIPAYPVNLLESTRSLRLKFYRGEVFAVRNPY